MGAALRAVPAEGAEKRASTSRRRTSIATAARSSDRRRLLVSLRDAAAKRLDDEVFPRDMVALGKWLTELAAEIAEIDAAVEGDDVSDAAATPDEVWNPSS